MKSCSKCETIKDFSRFHKRNDGYNSWCKSCVATYQKSYHSPKRTKIINDNRRTRSKNLRKIVDEIKSKPCTDCHNTFHPFVMQFDHVDPSTKVGCVSVMVIQARPLQTVLDEIAKCELVCANCHAMRTYHRRNLAEEETSE